MIAAIRERVHKIIMVRELIAFYRLDNMNQLRLQEKLAPWRRSNDFDKTEVMAERQHRTQGRVCSAEDPEHFGIEVYFGP